MLFNIHHGQVRFRGGKPIFRRMSPKAMLIMSRIKGTNLGAYRADKLGNIDITAPIHIDVMVGLGYPIYNGDGKTKPATEGDLLYPNLNMDSPYWRKINEAKNLRRGE